MKIQETTGPQTKYWKVQDSYKNTGIYRTAGITDLIFALIRGRQSWLGWYSDAADTAVARRAAPVHAAGAVSTVSAHRLARAERRRRHELSRSGTGRGGTPACEWRRPAAASISATHVDRADGVVAVPIAELFWTVLTTVSAVAISISVAHQ